MTPSTPRAGADFPHAGAASAPHLAPGMEALLHRASSPIRMDESGLCQKKIQGNLVETSDAGHAAFMPQNYTGPGVNTPEVGSDASSLAAEAVNSLGARTAGLLSIPGSGDGHAGEPHSHPRKCQHSVEEAKAKKTRLVGRMRNSGPNI